MTPTPCAANPDRFFDPATAMEAASECFDCPLFFECLEAGKGEEYGVWGGEVRPGTMAEIVAEQRAFNSRQAEVLRCHDLGMSTADITFETGYSESQVQRIVARHRTSATVLAARRREDVRLALIESEGKATNEGLAKLHGVSEKTVRRVRAELAAA